MGVNVVLYQPEIPMNTAHIALTCAATNSILHLIRPISFSTDEKMLKAAGIDFWDKVNVRYYDSIEDFYELNPMGDFFFIENFGDGRHTDFDYSNPDKEYFFIFGRETTGIPLDVIEKYKDKCLRIPMTVNVRSLNLSNTAAVLIYEALRQQGYPNLK